VCGFEPTPAGLIGRQRAAAASPDDGGDLLQGFGREHGAHLAGACLKALHAGDRPEPREEAGMVGVDRERRLTWKRAARPAPNPVAVPFDLAVAAADDGKALRVGHQSKADTGLLAPRAATRPAAVLVSAVGVSSRSRICVRAEIPNERLSAMWRCRPLVAGERVTCHLGRIQRAIA
jgi:hypothetical protein